MPPTYDEVLSAAQDALLGPAAVTSGFDGTSVDIEQDHLVIGFRWRRHPRQFQVRLPLGDLRNGPWTGVPTGTAEEWVHEVSGLLMEELDTGATHWAVRYECNGRIELGLDAGPPSRSRYYVSDRSISGASCLSDQGLDVRAAVAAEASGSLRAWLQMYVDSAQGGPVVAHVVLTGAAGSALAQVSVLQALDEVPLPDLTRLAHHGLCVAAEAGAERITCAFQHPALVAAGMRIDEEQLLLDVLAPWPVPPALRA
jgi:hypothetical protein